jgi:hypothetical protein
LIRLQFLYIFCEFTLLVDLDNHPLFERLTQEELDVDPCVRCVLEETEEGKKVARNNGSKYLMCYRRIDRVESTEWSGFVPIRTNPNEEEGGEGKTNDEEE